MADLRSVFKRTVLACSILLVPLFMATAPSAAWAAGPPVFTAASPADGSAVTVSSPQVSVAVSASAALSSSPSMAIDDRAVACWMEYFDTGGTWYDDGCEAWYEPAYDYTRGTVRSNVSGLANGSHTVSVRETDNTGAAATYTWTFTVSAAPALSSPSPSDGSWVATLVPTVSAKVAANAAVSAVSVTIDGIPASASYDTANKLVKGVPLAQLADGVRHTVQARVTDVSGLSGTLTWTFGVSAAGPAIGDQAPASGSVLSVSAAQIAFSASDPAGFTGVVLKVDGNSVPCGWGYVDTGGTWYDDGCEGWYEPAYDYTRLNAWYTASLKDGTHTVVAQVTSRSGLTKTSTWSFRTSSPPAMSSPSPADGAMIATLTPTISIKASDNGTIAASVMTVDGVTIPTIFDRVTRTIRGVLAAPLTDDGTYRIVATATDDSGLSTTSAWSFRTRTAAPSFNSATPAAGSVVAALRPRVSVEVRDAAGLGTTPVMTLDGVRVPCSLAFLETGGQWVGDGCDSWWEPTYDYTAATISCLPSADLSNGTHAVSVEEANAIGVKASHAWDFRVAAPPQLSPLAPADGSCVASLVPTVSAKVKSNAAIAAATVTVDGAAAATTYDVVTKTVTGIPAALANEASHDVTVTVTDVDELSASSHWRFRTDSTPPGLDARSPAPGSTIKVAGTVVSLGASDWSGMAANQVLSLDGVKVPAIWQYVEIGGEWVGTGCDAHYEATYDYTRGTLSYFAGSLSDGSHTVTAALTNSAGLTSTTSWSFDVAVPPQLSAASPADGSWVATLAPTVRVKVVENGTVAATSVFLDGASVPCSYDPLSKTVSARPLTPLLDDVSHTVVVTVTDGVGTTGSSSWSFSTHTGLPAVSGAVPETRTAVWDPVIAVQASDLSGMADASMKLDGAVVPAGLEYRVISEEWVGTGCDAHLEQVLDYTQATLSYKPPKLADGVHTATVQVKNRAGSVRTHTWSFEVEAPPILSDPKPSAGSVMTTQGPAISLAIAENSGIATVSATIDGSVVPAQYDSAAGRVKVLPGSLLANDVDHRVAVHVKDVAGNVADLAWTFHIQIYPAMTSSIGCADCHRSVGHSTSNCSPCHGSDCSGSGCHGNGHGTLYFGPSECGNCHPGNGIGHGDVTALHETTRDMSACRPCHVASLTTEHYRRKDTAGAALNCSTCHESTDARIVAAIGSGNSDCAGCHDVGAASHLDQHAEGPLQGECTQCHERNIVTEHLSNAKAQHKTLSCDTCHGSTDASVRTAIADGRTDCAGCHATAHGDLTALHTPADVVSAACGGEGCHGSGDAIAIHKDRAEGACAVCHANPTRGDLTAGKVTAACAGCHAAPGTDYHVRMSVHVTSASVGEKCGRCHHMWGSNATRGPDVTQHPAGCRTCHNGTVDTSSLNTECGSCHKDEGTDYHTQTEQAHTAEDAGSWGCARCHETTNVQQLHAGVGCKACHVTDACAECHVMHRGAVTPVLVGVSCTRCHKTSGTDYHRSFEASHTFSGMQAGCQGSGCHTNALVATHQPYVGPGSPNPQYADTCGLCHVNDDPARVPNGATPDCASCHVPRAH